MSAPPASRRLRPLLAIGFVTVAWGWTFVWMKQAVLACERVLGEAGVEAGIGAFLALRFALAAAVLAALPAARRGLDAGAWRGGTLLGGLLLAGFLLQMLGLTGVSPAVSAFLTSLYVVFTALLLALRRRRWPSFGLTAGTLLATFGAGFISGPPQLAFGVAEALTVGCAFVFALHILATDAVTRRHAPMPVTLVSFVVVAVGASGFLWWRLTLATSAPAAARWLELLTALDFAAPLLLSCLVATVLALSLMNVFQRELDPVRAAILYALEPVWASLIALGAGLAHADAWLWIGGGALLAGNLIAELSPRPLPSRASTEPIPSETT